MPPVLEAYRTVEHGLASLVSAADAVLGAIGASAGGDERVSSRPDARTLRYYQSIGVLDRPLRHDGREAVYGYRHLLQAVVTKLLQAEGLSLAQVQRALAGRPDAALEAAVVEALAASGGGDSSSWGGGVPPPATPPLLSSAPPPRYDATPAPTPVAALSAAALPPHGLPSHEHTLYAARPAAPRALVTREVAPGVLVTLDPRLVPEPEAVLARIADAVHLVPTGGSR